MEWYDWLICLIFGPIAMFMVLWMAFYTYCSRVRNGGLRRIGCKLFGWHYPVDGKKFDIDDTVGSVCVVCGKVIALGDDGGWNDVR